MDCPTRRSSLALQRKEDQKSQEKCIRQEKACILFSAIEFIVIIIVMLLWGHNESQWVRFQVFTASNMKTVVLWVVAPCRPVVVSEVLAPSVKVTANNL
jgi:hypothetical protein